MESRRQLEIYSDQKDVLLRMIFKFPENRTIFEMYKFNYERIKHNSERSNGSIDVRI